MLGRITESELGREIPSFASFAVSSRGRSRDVVYVSYHHSTVPWMFAVEFTWRLSSWAVGQFIDGMDNFISSVSSCQSDPTRSNNCIRRLGVLDKPDVPVLV